MVHFLLVFLGGGIGAAGRHGVNLLTLRHFGPGFPFGTLIVNVLGSFAMGLFIGWLVRRSGGVGADLRLFVATGVLGGFTTFSAFSLDVANLWQRGEGLSALGYVLATVVICVVSVFAGLWLARSVAI